MSLPGAITETLRAPTRSRLLHASQAIEHLLAKYFSVDTDFNRQVFGAVLGIAASNHGPPWKGVACHPAKGIVGIFSPGFTSIDFQNGLSKPVIAILMQTDGGVISIEAFDTGRFFKQIQVGSRHARFHRIRA
ncbi:hypothetical protein D3C84_1004390 [compost metagenome]